MLWYENIAYDQIVIASGAELIRNIQKYKYPSRCDTNSAKEIVDRVGGLLESNGFSAVKFSEISPYSAKSYIENKFSPRDFDKISTPHALYMNTPCNLAVAIGGRDHIAIRCITSGTTPQTAYGSICKAEELIDSTEIFAFSQKYGYYTQSISDVGTGMHAFSMLFLPALAASGQIDKAISEFASHGIVLRQLFGGHGNIFEIQNRETLGVGEADIISLIANTSDILKKAELLARRSFEGKLSAWMSDKCNRAAGILKYACELQTHELLDLISDVLLGIQLKLLNSSDFPGLISLIIDGLPANLCLKSHEKIKTPTELNRFRAEYVRTVLSGAN